MSLRAGSMIARASSGSRSCSSSVDPLISANSAVTVLRSASGAVEVPGCSAVTRISGGAERVRDERGAAGSALPVRAAPQSPQNLDAGAFSAPHFGQRIASPLPHWEQNFLPARFSVSHLEQRIELPSYRRMGNAPFVSSSLWINHHAAAWRRRKRYVDNRG